MDIPIKFIWWKKVEQTGQYDGVFQPYYISFTFCMCTQTGTIILVANSKYAL